MLISVIQIYISKWNVIIYLFYKPKCSKENDQKAVNEVFDELKKEITSIFSSYPIQKFCRKNNIELNAWAEYSEEMTSLSTENRIILYWFTGGTHMLLDKLRDVEIPEDGTKFKVLDASGMSLTVSLRNATMIFPKRVEKNYSWVSRLR